MSKFQQKKTKQTIFMHTSFFGSTDCAAELERSCDSTGPRKWAAFIGCRGLCTCLLLEKKNLYKGSKKNK